MCKAVLKARWVAPPVLMFHRNPAGVIINDFLTKELKKV